MNERLPLWFKLQLTVHAVVQVLFAYRAAGRVGRPLFSQILWISAVGITAMALASWLPGLQSRTATYYRRLCRLSQHTFALIVAAVLVAAGTVLAARADLYAWLGLQLLLVASLILLLPRAGREEGFPTPAIVLLALILSQVLRLLLVFNAPPIHDEGLYLSLAQSLQSGHGVVPAISHMPPGLTIHPFWGYLTSVYGYWGLLVGSTLSNLRLLSFLFGLLALLPVYGVARLWYGRNAALITVALTAWSWRYVNSVLARNVAMPMAAVAAVLYLHVHLTRKGRDWHHVFVGLLCLFLLETHIITLTVAFALGCTYLTFYVVRVIRDRRLFQPDPLWYFALGALVAAVIYILIHFLLPGFDSFMRINARFGVTSESSFVVSRIDDWERRLTTYADPSWIERLLVITSIGVALWRRTVSDRHWLLLLGFALFGYTLFETRGYYFYFSFIVPLTLVVTGSLFTSETRPEGKIVAVQQMAFMTLLCVIGIVTFRWERQQTDAGAALMRVFDEQFQPVRDRFDSGVALVGDSALYPYVIGEGYEFLATGDEAANMGAVFLNTSSVAYWADILLEEWPVAAVELGTSRGSLRPPVDSYLAARDAQESAAGQLVIVTMVSPEPLITGIDAPPGNPAPEMQLAAYSPLPASVSPGQQIAINTIWLIRQAIPAVVTVDLRLRDSSGRIVDVGSMPLISGWLGKSTDAWEPYQFHNVRLSVIVPDGLPDGSYTLEVVTEPVEGISNLVWTIGIFNSSRTD